ncbi:hypothetical protein EVAR_59356_1 [Eumeta japonica]|uniref:Uncharacterized protein n=1 Tax=Eumeta variegata TaxID=151549 RepID=A0A4C2A3J5_EUMVA|nr:hypothetical protein EVAR_59356_1 [Eumeta japonica]
MVAIYRWHFSLRISTANITHEGHGCALCIFPHSHSFVGHPRPQWLQARDGRLTLASFSGVFSSGIRPRRIQVDSGPSGRGPFSEVLSLVSSADQALPSDWGRRLDQFSWERSAARRPLVRLCNVPEKFMGALIGEVVPSVEYVLDEFLYGFDAEVASDNII